MTRHADPLQSSEAASRHFSRHIDDLRELRRNPIFARMTLFEATSESGMVSERLLLDAVRQRVMDALERVTSGLLGLLNAERAHRYGVVVREHILGGRSAQSVAGELHLSMREFYRQKRAVCSALAATIADDVLKQRAPRASVRLDAGRLALEQARLFMEGSNFDLSRATSEDVVRTGGNDFHKAEALCVLAEACIDQGFDAKGMAALEHARRAVGALGASEDGTLRAQLYTSESLLASATCDFAAANRLLEKATMLLQPLLGSGNEQAATTYARSMVFAGFVAVRSGDYGASIRSFQRALAAVEGLRFDSPVRAKALYGMASTAVNIGNTSVEEYRKLTDPVLELAQRSGLVRTAVSITLNRSLYDVYKGCAVESAQRDLAECWRISVRTDDRRLVTEVGLTISALELNAANSARDDSSFERFKNVLDVLQRTEECGLLDELTAAHVFSMRAQGYLGMLRFSEALTMARKAKRSADRLGNRRIGGTSLRVIAESCWARGNRKEALESAFEAVSMLEADGHLPALAAAYRTSARITGNAKHRRLAASSVRG